MIFGHHRSRQNNITLKFYVSPLSGLFVSSMIGGGVLMYLLPPARDHLCDAQLVADFAHVCMVHWFSGVVGLCLLLSFGHRSSAAIDKKYPALSRES